MIAYVIDSQFTVSMCIFSLHFSGFRVYFFPFCVKINRAHNKQESENRFDLYKFHLIPWRHWCSVLPTYCVCMRVCEFFGFSFLFVFLFIFSRVFSSSLITPYYILIRTYLMKITWVHGTIAIYIYMTND